MHDTRPIRLAVFDLDGTLIDSRHDLATAANALIHERGGSELPEDRIAEMVGEGAGVLVRRALAAAGLPTDAPDALPRFLELYDEHLLDATRPYAGMEAALTSLGARMPLAVLTNKPQAPTDRLLRELGLARFFARALGGDTSLGRKPDPAGLNSLVAWAGVDRAETVLVGDSPIDVETARRAGTRICVAGYGFGYRPVDLRPGELVAAAASDIAHLF